MYTATVDPLMIGAGYYFTRWYEYQERLREVENS